jgi:putative ABC transport system permease protein
MFKLTRKGLWARKRRLAGTVLAVFLGVAFLSGTLVLGDTMRASFDRLFADVNAGTDVVVRNATSVSGDGEDARGSIDASVVDTVKEVDGVAVAEPSVEGLAQIVDKDGKAIQGNGPAFASNWIQDDKLNPWNLVDGRAPAASGEIVIDRATAKDHDLGVGDRTKILAPDAVPVTIVGVASFGDEDGLGGTTFAGMTLVDAERLLVREPGRVSGVNVRAADGVSEDQLTSRIAAALPNGIEAISGDELTSEQTQSIEDDFLGAFRIFLLVFAGIALLVAVFSIHNTFAILVAQRTRESALLRAVGASQRQVLSGVVLEALVIGLIASIAGLFGGIGVAAGIKGMFSAAGLDLPANGITFKATTAAIAIPVGLIVTLLAAITPALKAGRVAPLQALREVAAESRTPLRRRAAVGAALTVGGALNMVAAAVSGSMALTALGGLFVLIGMVTLGPVVAGPLSRVLGAPLARFRGVTGGLARRNAARSPRRTAGAASALMVGVAVVTLFTVFAASLKATVDETVTRGFTGDLVVESGGFDGGSLSPRMVTEIASAPGVASAVGLGQATVGVAGASEDATIIDTKRVGTVLDFGKTEGSVAQLGDRQLAVSEKTADDRGWKLGTKVPMRFPDGARETWTVGAVYDSRDLAGDYMIDEAAWTPHADQVRHMAVLIGVDPGADVERVKKELEGVVAPFGEPEVQNRDEFVESRAEAVNLMLGLVYVMLALAILIALMGIANTLSLAVNERTRELGVLRAVGAEQRQVRRLVRYESVIVALFGALGGIGLGTFIGWAVVEASINAEELTAFSAPTGQLIAILVVGAIAGVLAAIRPARRAARLDVVRAVSS